MQDISLHDNGLLYFNCTDNKEQLTTKEWQQDIYNHTVKYYELLQDDTINADQIQQLINDNYSFWIEIVNKEPYKKPNQYMIQLTLQYINKPDTLYIDKNIIESILNELKEPQTENSLYWYEYKLRGFSIGCQPKGFIKHDETIGRYGAIAYDRPLTQTELYNYDLIEYKEQTQKAV